VTDDNHNRDFHKAEMQLWLFTDSHTYCQHRLSSLSLPLAIQLLSLKSSTYVTPFHGDESLSMLLGASRLEQAEYAQSFNVTPWSTVKI
jgi:hypothetical protein